MGKQSKPGVSSWIPSEDGKSFEISLLNSDEAALSVEYTPGPVIKELRKLFTLLYLQAKGIKVPLKLLVDDNSPFAGFLTAWYALGAYSAETDSFKRRAATTEEIENALKSIKSPEDAGKESPEDTENAAKLQEYLERLSSDPDEFSRMSYGVGRWTTLAADYVAEHLPERMQSALIQLMMEAETHTFNTSAQEKGVKPVSTKYEQVIVDTIVQTEEKMVKRRLRTRRPGGRTSPYDFSRFGEFYQEGKEWVSKAKKTLKTLKHLSRKDQHDALSKAYPQIEADLIDRMLSGEAYLSTTSHLAAEWAGRRCGLPANRLETEYPTTYLLQIQSSRRRKK